MTESSVKCYGINIDAAEVVLNIPTGVMDQFLDGQDLVGVYQSSDGQKQVLVYRKKEQAKQAVLKAKDLGFTSVSLCSTMIYVPEKDFSNPIIGKGEIFDEGGNGC